MDHHQHTAERNLQLRVQAEMAHTSMQLSSTHLLAVLHDAREAIRDAERSLQCARGLKDWHASLRSASHH